MIIQGIYSIDYNNISVVISMLNYENGIGFRFIKVLHKTGKFYGHFIGRTFFLAHIYKGVCIDPHANL